MLNASVGRARVAVRLACALLLPTAAHTQTPAPGHELDQVTVLGERASEQTESYVPRRAMAGTRSDTPLKDVPFALSAVTRALLNDQLPRSVGEALRNVAGYQPQPGFGGLNSNPRIRGFVPTSMLLNGFRQSSFIPDLDLSSIAQIEVLKGPASALYGRFEPGGVMNIVTKQPLSGPYADASITGGSDDFYRGTLDTGGPLAADRLLYRLNIAYEDAQSYRDFVSTRRVVVAPALEWRASEDTRVLLEARETYRDGGFDRGYVVPATATLGRSLLELPVERNLGEPTDSTLYHGFNGSLIVDHRLSSQWRLRVAGFWADTRLDEQFFTSGSPLMPNPTTYNRRALYASDNQRDYTFDVELSGRTRIASMDHTLLFGVDAGEQRYVYDARRVPTNSPLNILDPIYGQGLYGPPVVLAFAGTNLYRSAGFLAQDEIAIHPRWRLLLGGRYDTTKGTAITVGSPTVDKSGTVGAFSPRVGVTFAAVPAVSLYASFARSFMPEVGGVQLDGRMTEPSTGKQYEVGMRAEALGGRLLATAALYDLRKTNIVVSDPDHPGFSIQIGEQKSRGAELELTAAVTSAWNLIATVAHDDVEITDDSNRSLIGNRIVNVPEDTASLWSTYTLEAGAARRVTVGAGAFHVSNRAVNNANLFFLPSYTRLDAMVAYRKDAWSVALNLQNLTDEKYFDSAGGVFHPMPPRQWFLSAGYRFSP